jgi:hypothetical protein
MTYLTKAKKLLKSGFWMAGTGNFDITVNELAKILELVEKNDFVRLKNLYEKLEKERL